jgi:TRAP-type C4-dicarboxylate transport system substrate-binding protein
VVTSAPVAASPQDEPITLRLAIADAEGRPSYPYVLEFIEQARALSNGNIVIEPTWDAGTNTEPVFEQGVVKVTTEGNYDLGISTSRAWDYKGVTSFEALQAPFLIDNLALAKAVATSDIATGMLDSLSSAGIVGLTLWPEDLRHPISVVPDKPLLSPDDFAGATIRATPSDISYALIEALGGNPMFGDSGYQGAEAGLQQRFSLDGIPTATGNITFFPKFQVLFANGASFGKLSDEQRAILRDAAVAAQNKAIAENPSEADIAATWCAEGGAIVHANDEQVAAFITAAQPVYDAIAQDPKNAEWIAAIRELKQNTEPSAGAEACAQEVAQQRPTPTTDPGPWSEGLPPNGIYQVELTVDDFARYGVPPSVSKVEDAGVYTLTLKDGNSRSIWLGSIKAGKCQATYEVVEDFVRFTYYSDAHECDGLVVDARWRLDDKGLHFDTLGGEPNIVFEAKPWKKITDE